MIGFIVLFVVVLVILLATVLSRMNGYDKTIYLLERRITELERATHHAPTHVGTPPHANASPSPTIPAPTPPRAVPPQVPTAPPPPAKPSQSRAEFEAFVGGKLLNRIGALALIIGVGFFLKYAFDNAWINETGRVAIGVAIGGALLSGGMRSHARSFVIFAQGLFGAGLSILYLSVYASFNFYHLLPQFPAFLAMSVVTAIGIGVALRYDALAIACLAAIVGALIGIWAFKSIPFKIAFTLMFASVIWLCWRAWQVTELRNLIVQAFEATMRITAMVAFILVGATCFSITFQGVDGNKWVEHLMSSLPGGVWGFLIVVNLFVFFLAFFLDFFEIAFIIIPMLAPVAQKILTPVVGADAALIWFGVMICVNVQTSFMHPPFGFALFYLRSIAPKEVKSSDIYWGAIPWVFLQLCLVAILIFWPGMVTYWLDKEKKVDLENIKIELPVSGEGASKSEDADDSDKSQEEKDNDLSKLFSSPSPDSNQGDQKK